MAAAPGPSTATLLLLGTVHSDPAGFRRTLALLSGYRPDLVLVELSPYALAYRRENAARLIREFLRNLRAAAAKLDIEYSAALKHSRIAPIPRQISLPFEYRASVAYAESSGAHLVAADRSEFSMHWISKWPELISPGNLETLLRLDEVRVSVSYTYERAARFIRGESDGIAPWIGRDVSEWQERENYLASQIRSQIASHRAGRPLYIGGWLHLTPGGDSFRTLRQILGTALPECLLLDRGPVFS